VSVSWEKLEEGACFLLGHRTSPPQLCLCWRLSVKGPPPPPELFQGQHDGIYSPWPLSGPGPLLVRTQTPGCCCVCSHQKKGLENLPMSLRGQVQDVLWNKRKLSQVLVAHACNPSYSAGRDQEDHSSKPAWTNSSRDPISKNPSQKRAAGVVQGVGPEFKT
jgi:hypothetical protein